MGKGLTLADCAFLKNGGFTPASIPNLFRWWNPSQYDGLLANDTAVGQVGVSELIDQTGSGCDGTNGGFSGCRYRTNFFGTASAIAFGSAGTFPTGLNFFLPLFTIAGDFTAVMMVQNYTLDNQSLILSHPTTNHQIRTRFFASNDGVFYCGTGVPIVPLGGPGPFLITCRRIGANVTFRVNNGADSAPTGGCGGNWDTSQLGQQVVGSSHWMGDVIIYNVAVSDANLTLLYNQYLKPKFSLP